MTIKRKNNYFYSFPTHYQNYVVVVFERLSLLP